MINEEDIRKMTWNDIMPIGRYKGKSFKCINEIDCDYLVWIKIYLDKNI